MVLNRLSVIILEESLTLVKKSMDKFLHVASSFTYSSPISQTKPTATYNYGTENCTGPCRSINSVRETFCGLSQPHPIQAYNGTTIAVAVLGVLLILMLSAVLAIQIYDEYLDFLDKTLERTAKPWSTLLGAFLEAKRRVLNSPYGQQFEGITFTKTPVRRQSGKNLLLPRTLTLPVWRNIRVM